jgi:hypothetical protein
VLKFSEILENETAIAARSQLKDNKSSRMSRTDNFTSTYNSDNLSLMSDEYLHDDLKTIIDNKGILAQKIKP